MHASEFPQTVGGYRVGRRLAEGRFLGHALAPSVVELVFLDELSVEEQRQVFAHAQDFTSLPGGGRVAILPREVSVTEDSGLRDASPIRLTTPPDLAASWRHMEEVTASVASPPHAEARGTGAGGTGATGEESLLSRVSSLVRRARRGPVLLAVAAGVIAVVSVVLLLPASPSGTGANASAHSGSDSGSNSVADFVSRQIPTTEVAMSEVSSHGVTPSPSTSSRLSSTSEPRVPLSTLGDFVLVRVPSVSGEGPDDIAVLERGGDSWMVRETYPAK